MMEYYIGMFAVIFAFAGVFYKAMLNVQKRQNQKTHVKN